MQAEFYSCSTDANGMCIVRHNLGVQPESVVITPNIVGTNTQFDINLVRGTWNARTFTVRAMLDFDTPAAYREHITFSFIATSAPTIPPTTSDTQIPTSTLSPEPTETETITPTS